MSNAFIKFTDECGIHRRHTTRNRPQQNGVAERANRTMADDISAMLFEANLPLSLWGEAVSTQIHIWNCLPTSSLKGITPHKAWFKCKPDVSHLHVWGCLAYVFIHPRVLLGVSPVRTHLNTLSSTSNPSSRLQRPSGRSTPFSPDRIPTCFSVC